jgi:hypothetical protein
MWTIEVLRRLFSHTFLLLVVSVVVRSLILIASEDGLFRSDTVHQSRVGGNLTVVSYGYHDGKAGVPAWARKALAGMVPFESISCSVEILTIYVAPRVGRFPRRTASLHIMNGAISSNKISNEPMMYSSDTVSHPLAACASASPYGHTYTIADALVPRTMPIICYISEKEQSNADKCSVLSNLSSSSYFSISFKKLKNDFKTLRAQFKPISLPHVTSRPPFPERMIGCVVPISFLNNKGVAKLHLWIEYHLQLGLAVAVATESTANLALIPSRILTHPHVIVYAPGLLSATSFYDRVGKVRRGKFRPHFDTDKTITTTFIRFENRIYRSVKVYISADMDEFLFAPSAPHSEDLGIFRFDSDWGERCNNIRRLPFNATLWLQAAQYNRSLGVAIADNRADPLYQVHRPQLTVTFAVGHDEKIQWSSVELRALKYMGGYIHDKLSEYMCISDEYGMQVDIPRADVAHELHSETCIEDNLSRGVYSLAPCMEFKGVLQEGSTAGRAYKNKQIIVGQVLWN